MRHAQPWPRGWYRERGGAPWWLVVGPEGHGKSTLVRAVPGARESAPPAADEVAGQPRFYGAGGLAFVELPDEFTDQPAFLALLRKIGGKRPRQPVAGILVVVRLDLLDQQPEALLARTRAQIVRIAGELSVRPPVVLACTHLDRLAGFAEFCDGLPDVDRPLGVTLPACDSPQAVAQALQARLAEPLAWIRQRCHALVARPRPDQSQHHRQQAHLYGFWQQCDELAARAVGCAGFLAAQPLPGGESLRPRGVYFLAPTAGPPANAWLERLAQRTGGSLAHDASPAGPAPAFVRGLFATDLLRDSRLATRLRPFRWRRASIQAVTGAAAAGFAVYGAVAVTDSVHAHHEHMQATWDAAREVLPTHPRKLTAAPALDRLRQVVEAWRSPPPWRRDWGLFRGDLLAEPVAAVFTRAVCRGVLRPLAARSEQVLHKFVAQHAGHSVPGKAQQREILDHLRFYTLLAASTPEHRTWSGDEFTWLSDQVRAQWSRDEPADDATLARVLQAHAEWVRDRFAGVDPGDEPCTASGGAIALAFDDKLVTRTSQILAQLPPEDRVLDRLLEQVNRNPAQGRIDLVGTHVRAGAPVVPAFTRAGWDELGHAIRGAAYREDDGHWFLRNQRAPIDHQEYCFKLRDRYVDRYIDAWRAAVRAVAIDHSADLDKLEQVLRGLSDNTPLRHVFASVDAHTQHLDPLTCPAPGLGISALALYVERNARDARPQTSAVVGQRDARDIGDSFARFVGYGVAAAPSRGSRKTDDGGPRPLDTYHDHLRDLATGLQQARKNSERLPGLTQQAKDIRQQLIAQIDRGEHGRWSDDLRELVLPPLDDLILLGDKDAAGSLNQSWCTTVVQPLRTMLLGRYPFDPEARAQAAVADVTRLFHPVSGEIAKFRDAHLGGFVETSGTSVDARPLGIDADLRLDASVVRFLDDAHKLGLLFHPEDKPGLDLAVQMTCHHNINQLILTVDGGETRYICALPKPQSVRWPGEKDPRGAALVAYGKGGAQDTLPNQGAFALFKLLERGHPRRTAPRHAFTATFDFGKFGAIELGFTPQAVLGGSLVYGFGADTRFLAPMRTPSLRSPPQSLFDGVPFSCAGAP
nr:ImcF-related family protein [Nannocystis pusilla]